MNYYGFDSNVIWWCKMAKSTFNILLVESSLSIGVLLEIVGI